MFFRFVPKYTHIAFALATLLATVSAYSVFDNPFLLLVAAPGVILWAAAANRLGRRRLIRLATSGARRWRSTVINGSIGDKTARRVVRAAKRSASKQRPLAVFINSDGGDVASMRAIIVALQSHDERVVIIVLQRCMSAAAVTLCALPLSDRFAISSASIMVHSAHSVTRTGKKPRKMRKTTRTSQHLGMSQVWLNTLINSAREGQETQTVNGFLAEQIAAGTDLSLEFMQELLASGGDLYFTAETAHRVGFIARVIHP